MKRILVLGAGRSASYLLAELLDDAAREEWFVTVADRDESLAARAVGAHPRGEAVGFDVNDAAHRAARIEQADVVVNMLPAAFQNVVAWDCLNRGRHMLSVSYRDRTVRDLHLDAERRGILMLWELGLDPGIDHMSSMSLIERLRGEGGRIVAFRSYGSGIPAPGEAHNPLRYVVTWDPRNVVMAGSDGAQYMERGRIKVVPYHHLFHHTWRVEVDGIGTLEAYPNRDSMSYMRTFGLDDVHTMIRGTLRYPGWSETWGAIVRLGLPNESLRIPRLAERSYAEVVEMFLPSSSSGAPLDQRLARALQISPTGRIMENLRWLGLLSDERIGCAGETAAALLMHVLRTKLPLEPGARDAVVLLHELDVEYPDHDRPAETVRSTLVVRGETDGRTAMARTVGLPVIVAVKLLLADELSLTGSHLPTHPSIYGPILERIGRMGVRFDERRSEIPVA